MLRNSEVYGGTGFRKVPGGSKKVIVSWRRCRAVSWTSILFPGSVLKPWSCAMTRMLQPMRVRAKRGAVRKKTIRGSATLGAEDADGDGPGRERCGAPYVDTVRCMEQARLVRLALSTIDGSTPIYSESWVRAIASLERARTVFLCERRLVRRLQRLDRW